MIDFVESVLYLLLAMMVAIMLWAVFLVAAGVDNLAGEKVTRRVAVEGKRYEPPYTTVVNTVVGRVVVPQVIRHSERHILLISRDGRTESRSVDPDVYVQAEVGREMDLPFRVGRWTGREY